MLPEAGTVVQPAVEPTAEEASVTVEAVMQDAAAAQKSAVTDDSDSDASSSSSSDDENLLDSVGEEASQEALKPPAQQKYLIHTIVLVFIPEND